jgi:hypothetical protein
VSQQANYEFTAAENEVVQSLARNMKYVGLLHISLGALIGVLCGLTILNQIFLGVSYLLQTILLVIIGVWVNSASASFRKIVKTAGEDIPHLMSALDSLRKLYKLQFILLTAVVLLFIATLGMGLLIGVSTNIKAVNAALSNTQ